MSERDRLEFLGVDDKIILKWISENGMLCCKLRSFGSGKDKWWAVVNKALNLFVP